MVSWSDPIDGEIRDDQGICMKNPDTGLFMRYRLAGAYDSNVALLLATGATREESWRASPRCCAARAPRHRPRHQPRVPLRADELVPAARPVGEADDQVRRPVPHAGRPARAGGACDRPRVRLSRDRAPAHRRDRHPRRAPCFDLKETLRRAAAAPALRRSRTSSRRGCRSTCATSRCADGRVVWRRNPVEVLADTYRLLDMVDDGQRAAAESHLEPRPRAARHRPRLLREPRERAPAGRSPWEELDQRAARRARRRSASTPTCGRACAPRTSATSSASRSSHLVPLIGARAGFYELAARRRPDADHPRAPARSGAAGGDAQGARAAAGGALGRDRRRDGRRVLGPRGADLPPFVEVGAHFEKGQPLYIIEVMKMFNKVYAPFAGTRDRDPHARNGVVVRKGQPLFKVEPDEKAGR